MMREFIDGETVDGLLWILECIEAHTRPARLDELWFPRETIRMGPTESPAGKERDGEGQTQGWCTRRERRDS